MLSIYNYRTGVRRRTLETILAKTIDYTAIAGWILLGLILGLGIIGLLDDVLLILWEVTK
jgi:hypothetical protein